MSYTYTKSIIVFCFLALAGLMVVDAAPNNATANESVGGQIQRVKTLVHSQQLVEARPLLRSLRQNPEVDSRMHAMLDFHVALSYVFEYYDAGNQGALGEAIKLFTAFIQAYPNDTMVPIARYNIADLQAVSKNYKEALKAYIPLFNQPVPGIDRNEVLKKIILIYISQNQWVAGIPYFEAGMRISESSEDRITCTAYMLIAKAKQGDVSDSREYLSFFNSSAPVFYTPKFNASLMEIGDQLRAEGDLATASLFYRFVRSYESLEVGLTHYIESLKQKITQYEGNVVLRNFYQQTKTELDNAQADLVALKASANYTPLLNWRIAGVYMDMGRDWEAYWRFRVMVDTYPDHEYAEDITFSAFSLGRKLGQSEDTVHLAESYLENESYTRYRGTVADDISTDYLAVENYEEIYKLTPWLLKIDANDPAAALLVFKHGMARLTRFETAELITDFQGFKDLYGSKKCGLVINYFLGLGHLAEEHHQAALEIFEEVIAHSNTRFRADASFRKALCVMGLDRLDEAHELLLEFVKNYPDNVLRAQAELVLGNLVQLIGDPETALGHYYLIADYTDDLGLLATGELKIAGIYFDKGDTDEAIARLKTFIDANPEASEIIPVVVMLAGFYDQLEQPRVALNTIKGPLDQFFTMTEVDQLDGLLVNYLQKDRLLREQRIVTEAFFVKMTEAPDLLKRIIGDRGEQYRFFKNNPKIDALVKEHFLYDDAFRKEILAYYKPLDEAYAKQVAQQAVANPEAEAPAQEPYPVVEHAVLQDLKAEIVELNKTIPEQTADAWLEVRLAQAIADKNLPLVVRIESALAATQDPAGLPNSGRLQLVNDEVVWPQIGLAGKLWILNEYAKSQPEVVIRFLEATKVEYMNTSVELGMHKLLGECYEQVGQARNAIERYEVLVKRFASADEAGVALLKIGRLEIGEGNFEAARKRLETILFNAAWRGERHGQALLWIGRAYVAESKFSQAHGFFERIMLGYPGFNELLGYAYYEDVLVLKEMGEMASAKTVYEAFQMTPGLEETSVADQIRKEFE